jgi:hypothetical protein
MTYKADANEVYAIVESRGFGERHRLVDERNGVSNFSGVVATENGTFSLANAGSSSVMSLDSNGNILRNETCRCEVSGFYPVRNSVFQLTSGVESAGLSVRCQFYR